MAIVTKASDPSLDTVTARYADSISDLKAGEALTAFDLVYIKSDGLLWKADGTAATAPADAKGVCARAVAAGEPVTVFGNGCRLRYAASTLTPGATLYVGATAGKFDTAATTGGATGIAYAVTSSDIIIAATKL